LPPALVRIDKISGVCPEHMQDGQFILAGAFSPLLLVYGSVSLCFLWIKSFNNAAYFRPNSAGMSRSPAYGLSIQPVESFPWRPGGCWWGVGGRGGWRLFWGVVGGVSGVGGWGGWAGGSGCVGGGCFVGAVGGFCGGGGGGGWVWGGCVVGGFVGRWGGVVCVGGE